MKKQYVPSHFFIPLALRTVALVVLGCCWTVGVRANRILDIRSDVQVSGEHVRLGDLLVSDSKLSDEEREHVLISAPNKGASKTLTLVNLAYQLQRFPSLLDVRLRGPARISIYGGGNPEFLRQCREDLVKSIESAVPWSDWTVKIRLGMDDNRRLSAMDPRYESITVQPRESSQFLGSVDMDVAFLDESGTILSECSIQPTILREVPVLTLTETLERDHVLAKQDLRTTNIWVGSADQQYVNNWEDAAGNQLNRRLGMGELLRTSHLSAPWYSRRGDMVQVDYRSGGLVVSMSAQALENGRKGESIRLRNTTSDSTFRAILTQHKKAVYSQTR